METPTPRLAPDDAARDPARDPDRMVRTTVFLPARVVGSVRAVAAARGITSAAVIRSAVTAAVEAYRPPPRGGFL